MRIIVLIKSSIEARDAGKHDLVRAQWTAYRDKAIVKFFIPSNKMGIAKSDEIQIDANTTEDAIFLRAMLRWSRNKLFDYVFIQDIESPVDPKIALAKGLTSDYIGMFQWPPGERKPLEYTTNGITNFLSNAHPYALAKYGYFLSYVAVHGLVDRTPVAPQGDVWIGQVVGDEAALGLATITDQAEGGNV